MSTDSPGRDGDLAFAPVSGCGPAATAPTGAAVTTTPALPVSPPGTVLVTGALSSRPRSRSTSFARCRCTRSRLLTWRGRSASAPLPAFDTAAIDGYAVVGRGPWKLRGAGPGGDGLEGGARIRGGCENLHRCRTALWYVQNAQPRMKWLVKPAHTGYRGIYSRLCGMRPLCDVALCGDNGSCWRPPGAARPHRPYG